MAKSTTQPTHFTINWLSQRDLTVATSSAVAVKLPDAALWWMTDLLVWLSDFYCPKWRPQWGGSTPSYRVHIGMEKLEWLGYNLVKVAWWSTQSFEHNTSTWQTHGQPRRHSKCRANALHRMAKTYSTKQLVYEDDKHHLCTKSKTKVHFTL